MIIEDKKLSLADNVNITLTNGGGVEINNNLHVDGEVWVPGIVTLSSGDDVEIWQQSGSAIKINTLGGTVNVEKAKPPGLISINSISGIYSTTHGSSSNKGYAINVPKTRFAEGKWYLIEAISGNNPSYAAGTAGNYDPLGIKGLFLFQSTLSGLIPLAMIKANFKDKNNSSYSGILYMSFIDSSNVQIQWQKYGTSSNRYTVYHAKIYDLPLRTYQIL